MGRFYCLLNIFTLAAAAVDTGSHSLCFVATFIIGKTPFPEFTVVMMVDDIAFSYYNSAEEMTIMKLGQKLNEEEQQFTKTILKALHEGMRDQAAFLNRHFNNTSGVHTEQRLECCELLSNSKPGKMKMFDSFNGLDGLEMDYNAQQNSLHTEITWPIVFDSLKLQTTKNLYAYFLHPTCIGTLKRVLQDLKNHIFRKVKPKVRLLMKPLPESGGARVSCLATGFYPRHINLTLLRSGQPVSEQLVSGEELLPNDDGTYQMRKSLEISAEELRQRHNYTCTASHLSLDNKLDIHWDYEPGPPVASIVSSVLAVLLLCVTASIVAFIVWKKRCTDFQTSSKSDYSEASTTEEEALKELKN